MGQRDDIPSEETARAVLKVVAPGSMLLAVESLPGSYSNYTHVVDARSADGSAFRIVIRRYAVFGAYDRGEKACREFRTFELLQRYGIPVPEPLFLDETGATLGIPGIVTSYVSGRQVDKPRDPGAWARALATMLARIHRIPIEPEARSFLLDANAEATWFLRSGDVPDHMRAHPDGVEVWHRAHELSPRMRQVQGSLVHIDYWSGNILWDQGRISAILDWEEAAYGDPGIDVAYCRMDMVVNGMGHVADPFLRWYEAEMGQQVANLALWELAAAARPMFNPSGWISQSPAGERFRRFVADAGRKAGKGA